MNWSLLKSLHAVWAALIAAAFVAALMILRASPGSREGSHVDYVLWSGWIALGLMLIVTLYSLRKYVHRLRLTPEFKMKVPVRQLERAEMRINDLKRDILRGAVTARSDVVKILRRILAEEKVARICRPDVQDDPGSPARFIIRLLPTNPLGTVSKWLHSHVYYGLAAGVIVWLHGANSFESPLGALLNVLTWTVIASGVLGIFLFAKLPQWLTARERDFSFEDAFVQEKSLRGKIDEAFEGLNPALRAVFRECEQAGSDFPRKSAEALGAAVQIDPGSKAALQDIMVLVGQRNRIRHDLRALSRIRSWANAWRAVHIPATILLFGVVLVHVISVWWY